MTRIFSFKGTNLLVWAVVVAVVAGLFLHANHSTTASYKLGFGKLSPSENELPANAIKGSFEPTLW